MTNILEGVPGPSIASCCPRLLSFDAQDVMGSHEVHITVNSFLRFSGNLDRTMLEFVCLHFGRWVYPKPQIQTSCGNSFVLWRWMHMAISTRCPWSNRSGTCKGKWNIVITKICFWTSWDFDELFQMTGFGTVGTVGVSFLNLFFPAQLTSWYGILRIFVVIPPDRIVWPRVVTSSRPRRSSFWDQDLGRFVSW